MSLVVILRLLTCTDLPSCGWSIAGTNFSEWVQNISSRGNKGFQIKCDRTINDVQMQFNFQQGSWSVTVQHLLLAQLRSLWVTMLPMRGAIMKRTKLMSTSMRNWMSTKHDISAYVALCMYIQCSRMLNMLCSMRNWTSTNHNLYHMQFSMQIHTYLVWQDVKKLVV